MKLKLTFPVVANVGLVQIFTNSEHGSYDGLFVNGQDETENGPMIELVRINLGHERFQWGMNEAINNGGTFNEARHLSLAKYNAQKLGAG